MVQEEDGSRGIGQVVEATCLELLYCQRGGAILGENEINRSDNDIASLYISSCLFTENALS